MKLLSKIKDGTIVLAASSEGNPVLAVATVMLFFVFFNLIEGQIEKLIYGERFEHILDPIFTLSFMAYSAYTVYMCALYNASTKD